MTNLDVNKMACEPVDEEELQIIQKWIDKIPVNKTKKNIARDFADGSQMANVVAQQFPKLVDLHNQPEQNNLQQKVSNWNLLNNKVFKKQMGFKLQDQDIQCVVNAVPSSIERVLKHVQAKMAEFSAKGGEKSIVSEPATSKGPMPSGKKSSPNKPGVGGGQNQQNFEKILFEKDEEIKGLNETINVLELKVQSLEKLLKLKDQKIHNLTEKLSGK